jgi:hypothetical protein
MGKMRLWIVVAAALASLAASPVRAQSERFANLREWKYDGLGRAGVLKLNGTARYVVEGGFGRLRLTDGFGQASSFFIRTPFMLSDYEVDITFDVRRVSPGESPADGFMFVAQTAGVDAIGGAGGAIGYAGSSDGLTPPSGGVGGGVPGYSYGVEFNSAVGQGLPGSPETVGIDAWGIRTRFSQTPFSFVDRGPVTVAIRVRPEGLTARVLSAADSRLQGVGTFLQSPQWATGLFSPPAPLYLGFTAATGGQRQIVDIYGIILLTNQPLQ